VKLSRTNWGRTLPGFFDGLPTASSFGDPADALTTGALAAFLTEKAFFAGAGLRLEVAFLADDFVANAFFPTTVEAVFGAAAVAFAVSAALLVID
jgi:hypothetical protein